MPLGRRRPLRRAAVIGGVAAGAHHMGKKSAQKQQAEADQDAQIADLQDQQAQAAPAPAPAAAAPAGGEGIADQLAKLKSLLDSGVLTQAEFEAAKQAVIQGG
jgi:hypothetical protein